MTKVKSKEMSKEEIENLMKPRWKVIADYFYNPYKIGDVITLTDNNKSVHLTSIQYRDEFGENVKQENHYPPLIIEKYPHLFKKLEWWEERNIEDMPKYVRLSSKNQLMRVTQIREGEVFPVEWAQMSGSAYSMLIHGLSWFLAKWNKERFNAYYLEPATLSEYESYINSQNKG